ncbi:hypothetical protein FisN_26Hh037 [Fistulifera solaris]|uniref:Plastid lipid-associated protein/fibrillin conserved domain-containing protein n=1 Tax=Fistulifera solaris TaxID=1519565 RepID=A0A1Z5JXK9_FISSO|nr:hypothetical protein FisN_26Hh037 [Fistulifera solaris]|eukprot:GAX18744.1 hypothetical protein FisN_26Hh037 [Fistulifera solaris]
MRGLLFFLFCLSLTHDIVTAWTTNVFPIHSTKSLSLSATSSAIETPALSVEAYKMKLLQLGASLDRGQAYNPTSGDYYADRMQAATATIRDFVQQYPKPPQSMADIQGEWELVLSTVPHGIFRSSPFFLAIQEAYEVYAEEKTMGNGMSKADLFFKLHELQTCSWGISKVGRVAQTITEDYLYSEFDTSIFSLTVIPILGWFKLLPTFGGCVITAATAKLENEGTLQMKVITRHRGRFQVCRDWENGFGALRFLWVPFGSCCHGIKGEMLFVKYLSGMWMMISVLSKMFRGIILFTPGPLYRGPSIWRLCKGNKRLMNRN